MGFNLKDYFQNLISGKSGISKWNNMDSRCYSKIGGDLSDFDFNQYLQDYSQIFPQEMVQRCKKLLRYTPYSGRITSCAVMQAFIDSGLHHEDFDGYDTGHIMAGHNINARFIYNNVLTYAEEPEYIEPLYGLTALDTDVMAVSNEILNIHGTSYIVGGACASGNLALMTAFDLIRSGRAERVMVSAAASDLDPVCLQGWAIFDALSYKSFNDQPEKASRPFDLLREGFAPAQGSAAVMLESDESAKQRDARIYCELMSASCNSDASRLAKPSKEGQARVIKEALDRAGVKPEAIDYVNAHATSTPIGDRKEVESIKQVFGQHAYDHLLVNSTKSMIGHCLLAASLMECVATVMQMREGIIHPTINLDNPDPELDLDFVPHQARERKIDYALSNSFGFGGINSAIVLKREV
ncbi:beta-ketoacyl-[acyl-carrier-protein] synthase family protein [Legionella antarctica]|uniref:beta-ketoacyl-[acyl-carrier-protein] synthase family protein n=1 Tax=Legionella antarctica TaxID=2708020 RepID=UPI0015654CB5|nr:beta-ketoacyl-[acyl-carrier-protein] synthase family protein [Legionella antarctica]